jgi:hypothetical protein
MRRLRFAEVEVEGAVLEQDAELEAVSFFVSVFCVYEDFWSSR